MKKRTTVIHATCFIENKDETQYMQTHLFKCHHLNSLKDMGTPTIYNLYFMRKRTHTRAWI